MTRTPAWLLCLLLFAPLTRATAEQPASTRRMVERLAALEPAARPLANPFHTTKAVAELRRQLAAATDLDEQLPLRPRLAEALLNDGQSAAAYEQFDAYEQLLGRHGITLKPEFAARLLLLKGLCQLRRGEQENCLHNHNADSCLFPIQGGGVHQRTEGSRQAIAHFSTLLRRFPERLDAAWLLNIAYMTVGGYPHEVPPQWLLPDRVFASDYALPRFPDVAPQLGLAVDGLSGGVVMDDLDGDEDLDLLVSDFGLRGQLRLFRNDGDGTFADVTEAAGLQGLTGGLNLVQADYNNDGRIDVLVLRGAWLDNEGRWPNSLLRNDGSGHFTDVTEEAGLLSFHPTQTAVWFDYNGDGWIDVFIGNESTSAQSVHPCELYRNNGDGTFTECAAQEGVAVVGFVKAVVSADYDRNGRPDLFLSIRDGANLLFRNDGPAPTGRWQFTETAAAAGVTEPEWSFPAWFWDYDNDGWPDLLVMGYRIRDVGDIVADRLGLPHPATRARLYRNRGDGTFDDATAAAGLDRVIHAMGSNFGDLDNDGWLDFYAGTGDPFLGTLIPNLMFRNDGAGRFQDVTTAGMFGQLQKGHGVAFGDLNHDGAADIYSVLGGAYSGDNYPNQLFANPGNAHRWLKLRLVGTATNRAALGVGIKVVVNDGHGERAIYRTVGSGGSFGASPLRQEIGLGTAETIRRVEITWPRTGRTERFEGLQPNRYYEIQEDPTAVRERPLRPFPWPTGSTASHPHHDAHPHPH